MRRKGQNLELASQSRWLIISLIPLSSCLPSVVVVELHWKNWSLGSSLSEGPTSCLSQAVHTWRSWWWS